MLLYLINVLALLLHNALSANAQDLCRETGISGITGSEECGKLSVSMVFGLTGGRTAVFEEMPWQAGIYSRRSQPFIQICGGSLVSKRVVISAAHCFWNDLEKQLPAEDYSVAVGKLYRPWNDKMDINAQKSDIREIRIPPRYHGSTNNFQDDLALLVVATPFVINAYVLPICLDFDYGMDKKHLTDGNMGKVAGWGRTGANGKASAILQVLDLPSVDIQRCYDTIEPAFRPAITSDKICAGNDTGGTAVCMGDSGGGLAFTSASTGDPRFYLRGVVSTAPKSSEDNLCNVYTYATFTHVLKHEHFIREVIAASDSEVNVTNSASSTYIGTDLPNSASTSDTSPALEPLRLPNESKPTETDDQESTGIFHSGSVTQIKTGGTPLPLPKEAYDGIMRLLETSGPTKSDPDDGVEIKKGGTKNDDVIQSGRPQSDPDAEAEYTVKIIEEPLMMGSQAPSTEVKTGPATEKPYLSTATRPYLSTENNPVQPSVNQPEQSIENEPFQSVEIQLPQLPFPAQSGNQPPQSNLPDQSIVNLPTQSIVNLPPQSIGNRPDLSIVNLPPQSIVNHPSPSIVNLPTQSIGNRPDQSIVNLPPQSIGNRPDQSIVNLPPKSIGNRPDQSIVNLPPQSISNRPDQFLVNLPPQSIGNRPDQSIVNLQSQSIGNRPDQSIVNRPDQSIVNLPPQSIVNLPPQSIVNLPPQSIVNLPAESIEIQPASSIGNLPDQSLVNLPPQSIVNIPPQSIVNLPTQSIVIQSAPSIGNLPGQSQGIKQEQSPTEQPHLSAGSKPSVHIQSVTTTQTKSDPTHLSHKCTNKQTQALNYDHYHYDQYPHQNVNPHDYHNQHGHHYQHDHQYNRHGYHQSPHYNQHHNGDWHQLHNQW